VLRRRGADPDLVAAIERETARIDVIVRSLLDYARPRGAERDPLDVAALVDGAVALLDAQGALRGVEVVVSAESGLPVVRGDRSGIEQVFVNLLLNALDATGAGGRIAVRTAATRLGDGQGGEAEGAAAPRYLAHVPDGSPAVAVVIEDSGPGVPVELRERVFDPFFTTKAPGRGTGLGLAIVQRIVHDHGGRIDIGAGALGGASFSVTLPAEAS